MPTYDDATHSPTTSSDEQRKRVAQLVSDARICMLTTVEADGTLVSRPMGLQEAEFDGTLWFFASDGSAEVAEIRANPNVNVSFSNMKAAEWVSIAGRAETLWDRARAEELWNPMLNAWFTEGLDTDGLTLIKVDVSSAQYWDGPGSRVVRLIGLARAAITRDPSAFPDTEQATVAF